MSDTPGINYTTIPRKDRKCCGNCAETQFHFGGACSYAGEIGNHYCDMWAPRRRVVDPSLGLIIAATGVLPVVVISLLKLDAPAVTYTWCSAVFIVGIAVCCFGTLLGDET
jgi:hypothetical protein